MKLRILLFLLLIATGSLWAQITLPASSPYTQDFNTTPGALGTTYPTGWTSYNGSSIDNSMTVGGQASNSGANYNYVNRIGILGSGTAFNPGYIVLAISNTTDKSNLKISYDIIKIREQGRSNSFNLEVSTTSATSGFTAISGGSYSSGTIAETTITNYSNIDISALDNISSTVWIRWHYSDISGSGSRDGIALDNVVISWDSAPTTPTITTTPETTLSLGTTICQGTSSETYYTLIGANLTGSIELTPTADIEISHDYYNWYDSNSNPKLTVAFEDVESQIIFVRSKNTLGAGNLNAQSITHTSTDATNNVLAVIGTVIAPQTPTVSIALTSGNNPLCDASSVAFTATPSNIGGGNVTYQWKRNGSNVGSNQATYTLNSPVDDDIITCEITVTGGCVLSTTATSNAITMTVNTPPTAPTIASNNSPQCQNVGVTLTRGNPPAGVTYYWQGTNANGTDESNSSLTYTVAGPSAPSMPAGTYYLRAKNNTTGCWSDATAAVVTFTTPATVTDPQAQTVAPGNSAVFSVTTTGTISLIQWQVDKGSGFVNVTGADGTLSNGGRTFTTVPTTLAMNGYKYRISILGSCLSGQLGSATLTVAELPWEDFETGSKGGYAAGDVTCTAGEWRMDDALIGSAGDDKKNGSNSVRLRNSGFIQTNFNIPNGVGTVKVHHARYGTDANTSWRLVASTDDGATWTAFVGNTVNTTSTTLTAETITVNLSGNVRLRIEKLSGNRLNIDDISITPYSATPEPKLTLTQNSNPIANTSGNYYFGNQLVATPSGAVTFTIQNTGNADLTLGTIGVSGANASDFLVTQVANATLEEAESTTFTVTFTPSSLGSKIATITIPNNDNTNYTFFVSGDGSYASDSDIVTNTSFTYTSNINYTAYQANPISNSSHSVGVFQFTVRDGGETSDADALPTTLTDVSINYTGTANTIRAAALFNGNSVISNGVVTANGITFSGLSIVAPDNGSSPNITLRVTFTENVTDNQKLVFTVASATADSAGSVFGSTNASGAFSDNNNANDRNRIEVVADRLVFAQEPSNANINIAMAPAVVVSAEDSLGNRDLDFTGTVDISSTGTLTGTPVQVTAVNGLATFSNLVHTAVGTGLKLTATSGGWTQESDTFNVIEVVIPNNSYRTTSAGTWPGGVSAATWERFNGTIWSTSSAPSSNSNDLLIIRHTINTANSYGAEDGQREMIIEDGGEFISNHPCVFGELVVKSNGVFEVRTPQTTVYAGTGTLTVEDGGKLVLNSNTLDSGDGLWNGIENFYPNSTLEIKDWDWDASPNNNRRLIPDATRISTNSEGYFFGDIYFDATPVSDAFSFVQPTGTYKLCNDLKIKNGSSTLNVFLTQVGANVEIGGNIIAEQNTFSFAAVGSSLLTHTVHGDIITNGGTINLNQTSSGSATVTVNVKGNVNIQLGSLISTDDGCKIVFTGMASTPQTINILGTLGERVDFEVASDAEVHLINQDLNLVNATNDFTVLEGGSLYFNYFNIKGNGKFHQNSGGILKITDAQGINTSGSIGNIQTVTRNFSQTGHFHYVGNASPQSVGNVFGSGSTSKRIVINKDDASNVVNLTSITGTSNELYIAKGIFVETETANIFGSGNLTIDNEGYLKTAVTSISTPRLSGTYNLAANSTVELNSNNDQTLNSGKAYGNLIFSNGGITTSGATPNIAGTVTIKDDTTLDVGNSTFGGSPTNLVMQNTSLFINGGAGTKPNIGGTYTLDSTSTIEFTGSAATQIRVAPNYANIIISGTNVTAGTTNIAGLTIQDGTTFTIKDGATFKVPNPQGMYGNTQTAIKNSPAITFDLEANSTVEYNAAGEEQLISKLNDSYGNLALKGAESVKKLPSIATGNVAVKKDVSLDASVSLDIESGKTLLVGEKLNNSGEVLVRNSANFIQLHSGSDQNVNSGNFKVERVTRPMNRYSYTYWGAPVSTTINNAGIQWFIESVANSGIFNSQVPSNQLTQIYKWNPAGQSWDNAIGSTTVAADGFIAKAPNNFSTAANNRKDVMAVFQGAPFNGNITKAVVPNTGGNDPYTNAKMTFMSNPYPSAINIDKFLLEYGDGLVGSTPVVVPTVYLWTHASLPTNGVYSASDFATYTLLGGTATEPEIDNDSPVSLIPEGKLASGQGFFIRGTEAGGTVTLKNSYRYADNQNGYDNQQFFRMATEEHLFERHRFWLNLKGNNAQFKQTLIGYSDIASDGVDGLDGSYYEGGNPTNLYTILDNHPFVIQAYALPFDINDEIPLGFKVGVNGSYTIGLDNFDGLFESQTIYLKDSYQDVVHNLNESDYQFTAQSGNYTDRFKVIFKPYSCDDSTIWNGTAWSNGLPTLSKKAIIQGDLTLTENTEACEVIVQSGILTLTSGVTLTVTGMIDNLLAANNFVVENEANLIQIEDVDNNGAIKVYRNSEPIKHLDYTIWSSPVDGQVLQGFSPQTLPHRIYTYNNGWQNAGIVPSADTFKAGEAYMFRAPNNFVTMPYIYNGLFTGTPNNGAVELALSGQNFIGLGNPYPSNLKIDGAGGLRTLNPGIGSLYFWTNTNPYDNTLQSYTGNNWSIYSLIGGIAASNDDFDHVSNGYIPVGQGFIAEAPSVERLTFNNQMRTSEQGTFFRIAQDEMHRYWLDFRKEEQVLNKILVGYTPESTSDFDFGIDAKLYGYNGSALYTLISENTDAFAIQGRALPFDTDDVVQLGYKAEEAGTYTISLVNLDGLFQDTDIFIKDKMLNIEHNIKSGVYEFVTQAGEFSDRLEIVYRTNLSVENPIIDTNWIAYTKDNQIRIESLGFDMKEVYVYDMLGREIYSDSKVNSNKHQIQNLGANQVVIIKIITPEGTTSVKKFQN